MTADVTWWGHASCTVELGGRRVLTDPVLTHRVAHLSRPGLPDPPAEAARADVVVVSHLHADHLHLPSLRRLDAATRLIVPTGAAAVLRGRVPAAVVTEVGEGDEVQIGDLRVQAVHAEHDGRRLPGSRHRGPALGFVLHSGTTKVWFAGDTGLFDALSDIGPVDAALVPVGGWGPTLGPEHLDPARAVEAVRRVGAGVAVPIHYGTLWPAGLRWAAPRQFERLCRAPGREFAALVPDGVRAHVPAPGSSVRVA
ncbi:MBL fold metallo-hydrolase [Jatrophihabitans endophyticus]|uniref:MBL fold metallo-hydrolase n=1 Tax=Jatrophihabitans endophyticus TaxID=1206085 RepID=UPI0019DE6E3D|nr:MBL fold metallo-hydrolase [Jatrophihabitans endophyticus]MBE7189232.1 MBL fold metallo-hydrolase [Jatrophihabitans endophyticus]